MEKYVLPDLMEPAKLTISNDNILSLEYFVEDREGLYKRNYTNNIFDEIISLVDFDFSFMSRYRKILVKYFNRTKERKELFPFRQFFVSAKRAVKEIEKYSKPISAILYLHIQQIEEALTLSALMQWRMYGINLKQQFICNSTSAPFSTNYAMMSL